jgi:hypothetical protein
MANPFGPYIKSVIPFSEECLPEGKRMNSLTLTFDIDTPQISLPFNYPSTASNILPVIGPPYFGYSFDPTLDKNGQKMLSQVVCAQFQIVSGPNLENTPSLILYSDFSMQQMFLIFEQSPPFVKNNVIPIFCAPGGHIYVLSDTTPNGYININFFNFLLPAYFVF